MKMGFLLDIIFKGGQGFPDALFARAKTGDPNTYGIFPGEGPIPPPPYIILDLPSYQRIELKGSLEGLKKCDAPLYPGFLIDLSPFETLDHYLKAHFPTTKRMFRRQGDRLNQEVGAPAKILCNGPLDAGELELIFARLGEFLTKRFAQKESENYEIPLLERYKQMFRGLVPKGEAVLFTRTTTEGPIAIGIGFVHGQVLYLFNIAFDVAYGRYGLGNLVMLDVLQWCYEKGIATVDMGRGDFIHKRKWVNGSYTYRGVYLYAKGDVRGMFGAAWHWAKNNLRYHLIALLKKWGAQHLARKFFLWKYRLKNNDAKN